MLIWEVWKKFTLRQYQKEAVENWLRAMNNWIKGLIVAPTGSGKCLQVGTKVIMFDWSARKVEEVNVWDFLMWPDWKRRKVLWTNQWESMLYKISTPKWDELVVNWDHLVHVKIIYGSKKWQYQNIRAEDLYKSSRRFKHIRKLIISKWYQLPSREVYIDPYWLGLRIWDWTTSNAWVTNPNKVIQDYIIWYAEKLWLQITWNQNLNKTCPTLTITNWRNYSWNTVMKYMKEYWIRWNKFVPEDYILNSKQVRLQVLAWMIDTDWSVWRCWTYYSYCSTKKVIVEAFSRIWRSLWYYVSPIKSRITYSQNWTASKSYNASIVWDCHLIPTKYRSVRKRIHKKNYRHLGIKIEEVWVWKYAWFQLDKDHLFLTENHIINHNSLIVANIAKELSWKTIIFQPSKEILEQNYAKYMTYTDWSQDVGIYSASAGHKTLGKVVFATIWSVVNKLDKFKDYTNIIIDEADLVNAKWWMYKKFIEHIKWCKVIWLTATPYRLSTNSMWSQIKFLTRTRPRIFEKVVYAVQVKELLDKWFLSPLEYYKVGRFDRKKLHSNSTGAEFSDKSIKKHFEEISFESALGNLVNRLLVAWRKSILVFTKFVVEAELLSDELWKICEVVSAKTKKKDRERILEEFKSGKVKVVANVGTLTVWFDFPELSCVVLARPTKSLRLYYQMVGRWIRPHPNKESWWIVDMCWNSDAFGKVEDLHLHDPGRGLWAVKTGEKQLTNVYI